MVAIPPRVFSRLRGYKFTANQHYSTLIYSVMIVLKSEVIDRGLCFTVTGKTYPSIIALDNIDRYVSF